MFILVQRIICFFGLALCALIPVLHLAGGDSIADVQHQQVSARVGSAAIQPLTIKEKHQYVRTASPKVAEKNDLGTTEQESVSLKPRLIIHLGPMKTGTTSVQFALSLLARNGILERDNWHYANQPHKFTDGTVLGRELSLVHLDEPDFVDEFKRELDLLRPFNRNIIISQEKYAARFSREPSIFQHIKEKISEDWDVQIVAGYRIYYDWFESLWSQMNGPRKNKVNGWDWKNPHNGELNYVQAILPDTYSWVSEAGFYVDTVVEYGAPHVPVRVLDIQDPRGLIAAVVCDAMEASASCEEEMRKSVEIKNKGSLDKVRFEEISLTAAQKGMIDIEKWTRTDVADAIQTYLEQELQQTAADLPYSCPDEAITNSFLETSLEMDRKYAPESSRSDPDRETKLREFFQKKMDEKVFCMIDTALLFDNDAWQTFFSRFS